MTRMIKEIAFVLNLFIAGILWMVSKSLVKKKVSPTIGDMEEFAGIIWKEVEKLDFGTWDVQVPVTTEIQLTNAGIIPAGGATDPNGVTSFYILNMIKGYKLSNFVFKVSGKKAFVRELVRHEYRHACQFTVFGQFKWRVLEAEKNWRYGQSPIEKDAVKFQKAKDGEEISLKEVVEAYGFTFVQ